MIGHDTAKQSVLRYLSSIKSIDGSEAGNYPILVRKADSALYMWTLLEPLDRVLEKLWDDEPALPRVG